MEPTRNDPSPSPSSGEPPRRRPGRAFVLVLVLAVVAYVALRPRPVERRPLVDVFAHLEAQGYTPNPSLAGRFRPGDVVQLAEAEADGARPLATPLLALRGEECFPELEPLESAFPLPATEGKAEAAFGLEGARLAEVLPGLAIRDQAAGSYRLSFDQPRLLAHAKLDLSGRFDRSCVEKLRRAEAAGDRPEWFATVVEAVVARAMTFEVEWRRELDADLRLSLEARAEEGLQKLAAGPAVAARAEEPSAAGGEAEDLATAAAVRVTARDERKTVLRAELPVVLGFRTRPLQYETPAGATDRDRSASPLGLAAPALAATGGDDVRGVFLDPRAEGPFVGRLAIRLRRADGTWQRVAIGRAFSAGDRFRFEVESAQPAFLYVFHRPPGGAIGELWPGTTGQDPRLTAGEPRQVPLPPAGFELDAEDENETFFVALARDDDDAVRREEPLGNYVLRGLPQEGDTRGVGIVYEDDPWLYFEPSDEEQYLAAVRFELQRNGG